MIRNAIRKHCSTRLLAALAAMALIAAGRSAGATDACGRVEIRGDGVTVTVSFQPTSRTGLVAEYGFDQGSGTALTDTSGSGNTGTIANATWAPGKFGQAIRYFQGQIVRFDHAGAGNPQERLAGTANDLANGNGSIAGHWVPSLVADVPLSTMNLGG